MNFRYLVFIIQQGQSDRYLGNCVEVACMSLLEKWPYSSEFILIFGRKSGKENQRALISYVRWLFSFDGNRQNLV